MMATTTATAIRIIYCAGQLQPWLQELLSFRVLRVLKDPGGLGVLELWAWGFGVLGFGVWEF